ncbi:hypothetical protein [Bradyrhizobium genosp. P]|uniref:hypothetical protein n=1 Tax=Bradyrhizobium genosp. P TaxID=83641 RepID=UPI003CE8C71A
MLPGLRFLFAAIVLATSILVFGLGAAALFRAAHEEFASIPARPAPREPQFAQQTQTPPVLAMLRVDPPPAGKATAETPAPSISEATAPAEVSPPAEPDKIAAVKTDDLPPPATPKSEAPPVETTASALPAEAAPLAPAAAEPATQQPAPAAAEAAPAPTEPKLAAVTEPPAVTSEPAPAATGPAIVEPETVAPPSPEAIAAATRIATLGGPEVVIPSPPAAKAVEAKKPDHSATGKPAHRKERRRIARARHARKTVVQQQALDPFGQPTTITAVQRQ